MGDLNQILQRQEDKKEKASFVIGIVAICFAALAAGCTAALAEVWRIIGGVCCGWAGCPLSFVGIVLSIVSLAFKRSAIGWWALGLSFFSVVWIFISGYLAYLAL